MSHYNFIIGSKKCIWTGRPTLLKLSQYHHITGKIKSTADFRKIVPLPSALTCYDLLIAGKGV